jgi:hypothetical protein
VAFFGIGLVVCADNAASDDNKAASAPKEVKADKTAKAAKNVEVENDKVQAGSPILKTALLYIPNRVLDLLDIVTFNLGAGPEFGVEVRATRWIQVGGMYGDKYFIGKNYARQIGGGYSSGWNYEFLCFTSERRYVDETFGTTSEFILKRKPLGFAMPSDDFTYSQDVRDFWEIGANAGWLITLGAAVHPVEIADFLAGLVLIDLKGDDYGSATCAEKAK